MSKTWEHYHDAARHHQGHRFQRLKDPKQDRAGDGGERKAGKARNKSAGEDGGA